MNIATATLVENSFKKIFKNVAKELFTLPENIQLGIYYTEGVHKYMAYKNFTEGMEIKLEDYMDVITASLAGGSIDAGMANGGQRYAAEMSKALDREVSVNEVSVLMCYKNEGMPRAVLMCAGQKVREIDIEKEF